MAPFPGPQSLASFHIFLGPHLEVSDQSVPMGAGPAGGSLALGCPQLGWALRGERSRSGSICCLRRSWAGVAPQARAGSPLAPPRSPSAGLRALTAALFHSSQWFRHTSPAPALSLFTQVSISLFWLIPASGTLSPGSLTSWLLPPFPLGCFCVLSPRPE